MKIFDISRGIMTTPVYPGDPEPRVHRIQEMENEHGYQVSILEACVHTGTHVDSPAHCISGGRTIEELPLDIFIGPARVVSLNGLVGRREIESLQAARERILCKGHFMLEPQALEALMEKGLILLGTEMESIGNEKVHRELLGANIGILELVDLSEVEEGSYYLFAPPVKIEGSEGAFARAVLIEGIQETVKAR